MTKFTVEQRQILLLRFHAEYVHGGSMSLFAGILIGFILALPPGGIVLVGMNLAMQGGFRRAVPYAWGTMLVDTAYALLAVLGAGIVVHAYKSVVASFPVLVIGMQSLIIAALLGYGLFLFLRRTPTLKRDANGGFDTGRLNTRTRGRTPFLLGVGLNISNIFSPTFLAALAIVATQAHAFGVRPGNTLDAVLYAIGFGIGNTLYMQIGMKLVEKYTSRLQPRHLLGVQKIAGIAFAAIGGLLFVYVVQQ
jgi:threonine/homoserine/homoserine lactone efflux protein